jgi:hypothetical protein
MGNVPGYTEPKCFVSEGNEKQLVYAFVDYLDEMSLCAHELVEEKYSELTTVLKDMMEDEDDQLDDDGDNSDDGDNNNNADNDNNNGERQHSKRKGAHPIRTLLPSCLQWS